MLLLGAGLRGLGTPPRIANNEELEPALGSARIATDSTHDSQLGDGFRPRG
jgi:hypothetical protein